MNVNLQINELYRIESFSYLRCIEYQITKNDAKTFNLQKTPFFNSKFLPLKVLVLCFNVVPNTLCNTNSIATAAKKQRQQHQQQQQHQLE